MKLELLRETLLLTIFLHYKVRKNKKMAKRPSFETTCGSLTWLLTLRRQMFSDKSKFKKIIEGPTNTNKISNLQRYLKQFNKRGALDDDIFKKIRPQSARISKAHRLPKMHRHFDNNPPFQPIADTTGTTHYSVGKYLSELLSPLTQNEYSLTDSFDAANRINRILPLVLEKEEYMFVSLDVVSLFANVPLRKTVNIILEQVYNKNPINTSLSKTFIEKVNSRYLPENNIIFQ